MAEAIGVASGVVALTTTAFNASVALHDTIKSFQSHQQRVRDLTEETSALSDVLSSLADTAKNVQNANGLDLAALEMPLRQCGKACQEFEREILKCSSRSGGGKTSFRDWARLRYMGEDIDAFRRRLSEHRMTITVALMDVSLRQSTATSESIEGFSELLNTARADLEDRLERIDEKINLMLGTGGSANKPCTPEMTEIKEERLSTEKSLQICAQLSQHISEIQLSTAQGDSSDSNSTAGRLTNESLQECKDSLSRTTAKLAMHEKQLFGRMLEKLRTTNASPEEVADVTRLRDEWESTRQSMNILSAAGSHLEERASVIENHATGDAVQIMVSANGKTLHGTNRGLGWRTRQVGGYLSNETVRQISRDMVDMSVSAVHRQGSPVQGTTKDVDNVNIKAETHADFKERYGDGFKLSKDPT